MTNVEFLVQNIGDLTSASVALVALAGLIIGVAPSSFPLIAVAGGLGARDGTAATSVSRLRGFCLAAGFGLGITTVDAVLGGLSTCPACTPLLLPVVVAATSSADPIKGAVLMGSFGLARSIPLVATGVAASSLTHWPRASPVIRWTERIGGGLLMAVAAWVAWQTVIYAGWA